MLGHGDGGSAVLSHFPRAVKTISLDLEQVELIMSSLKCCDAGTKCRVIHKTGHTVTQSYDNVVRIRPVSLFVASATPALRHIL